jgi:release factor glutamine methyltransferase
MKPRQASSEKPWTILKLLKWAAEYFNDKDIDEAKVAAEILLAQSLHLRRIDLYLQYDRPLEREELSAFKILLKRKLKREPVAYIVGHKEFWSMPFAVNRDVLIPRPETECLVEVVMGIIEETAAEETMRVLELGTGSGALIIALASQKQGNAHYASDISKKSLVVAKQNAVTHGLNDIHFFAGDWMNPLTAGKQLFDVIVSNPPYIPTRGIETLAPEIRQHEPLAALDGGKDGLKCLRHIVQNAWVYLKPRGWLALEMGCDQKEDMMEVVRSCGKYDPVRIRKDYSGHDRIISMRKAA